MLSIHSVCGRVRVLCTLSFCALAVIICLAASRQRAGATLLAPSPDKGSISPAATITVNSTSDAINGTDGLCTLREAINAANNNSFSGPAAGECAAGSGSVTDMIDLTSLTGTINLTGELPSISSNVNLVGPGAAQLTVRRDTGGNYRIFQMPVGALVTVSGLTLTNGVATSTPNGITGGAIYSRSTLTLRNMVITANSASPSSGVGSGGAIFNDGIAFSATLTILDSVITGNSTNGSGGAIASSGVAGNASVIISNTTISNNTANSNGAISSSGQSGSATVRITNSTVSGNTATNTPGIGVTGDQNGTSLLIASNTTISGNNSTRDGGAITIFTAQATIVNCTVTNNRSDVSNSGFGNGAGIKVSLSPGGPLLKNNIVDRNFNGSANFIGDDIVGAVNSASSFNLIGVPAGGLTNGVNNNQVGVTNPGLAALANNGGPTQTHALLSTSPALDAADNCVTAAAHCGDANIPQLTTDQRGFLRQVDGPDGDTTATVDIGAYETPIALANLPDATTNEDTTLLVGFDPGDPVTVTSITATSGNSTLVPNDAAHLNGALNGTSGVVTINPAGNLSGTTNINVTLNRTGGGSENKTFQLTVAPVNDVPSFTKGANQTVLEDAGAQTVNNWATGISAGPPDEAGQTLTFQVTSDNPSLFSSAPAISSTGTLSYTTAADANGTASLSVVLKDSGGTANGGVDTSSAQDFVITVIPVNDPPSFTRGPDQTVNNNAGAQTIPNWATNISRGPANEFSQSVNFQVLSNSNPSLFATLPNIDPNGTLNYRPAANMGGTATMTVNLKDTGATFNGGNDTSPSQSFTITVVPVGGFISFSAATYNTTESSGATAVTIKRTGDLTRAVTVDYASSADNGLPCSTANGVATPKCDFTHAFGTLNFAAGEDTKVVSVLISQDGFVEGPETFSITLSNPTGFSALGAQATATTTIADDGTEPAPPTNVIDDVRNFVRQHYHDFLNREPDTSGWDFWSNQITSCGSDVQCNEVRRIDVSASFFLSIEFQQTGYLVERFYKVAYGSSLGNSTLDGGRQLAVPIVRFNEFQKDTQRIGQGVIVLAPGWEQALENNKQAYALEFVQTIRFNANNPTSLSPSAFVDRLDIQAGGVLSANERTAIIALFGGAGNSSDVTARAPALRMIAEDQTLYDAEFNRAFVLAQYFGYLRRNPNDAPESTLDYTGYDFWLTKLNQFNGSYVNAEMVKAFLSSIEYRQRFGP